MPGPWPNRNDQDDMSDYLTWQHEVANGDTILGFREWQTAQKEDS